MHLIFFWILAAAPAARAQTVPVFEDEAVMAEAPAPADDDAEAESRHADPSALGPGLRYSGDLSDSELRLRWEKDLESLGTISVGFADQGRLINAVHMPEDPAWICQRPELAWGTQETVDSLATAFRAVHAQFPDSAPARLSHIGQRDGGYLKPHRSHQSGRDADIGFFYKNDEVPGGRARRDKAMDPARNWALIKALVTQTDVQMILVDRGIQKILKTWALANGEDPVFVGHIFAGTSHALVQHARRHKDHFHVRFFAPRSQELGRRIQPLLAQRPEQNIAFHKVRRGDTLGYIAKKYGTTVAMIQKASNLRGHMLHLGQQLRVPLRGACTHCPLPPPVVVPPRLVPPAQTVVATTASP